MNASSQSDVTNCKISIILKKTIRAYRANLSGWRLIGIASAIAVSCNFLLAGAVGCSAADSPSKTAGFVSASEEMSFFGVTLQEAFQRHFFSQPLFRFRLMALSVTKDGFTEVVMRLPRASRFRPFVTMYMVLDSTGKIIRSRIQLKRRFIEDKVQSAFARDFAKSFVQAAVPEKDFDKVRMIANEIFFRQEITKITGNLELPAADGSDKRTLVPTTVFKIGKGKLKEGDIFISGQGGEIPADLPKKHSDLYKVFTGKSRSSRLKLSVVELRFANELIENEETLVISVSADSDGNRNSKPEIDYGNLPMHIPGVI